jgi:integrase
MGFAGLRAGEALGLTWSAVDLDKQCLDVRQQAIAGAMAAPKTKASVASVPMLPELSVVLSAYREAWKPNAAGLLFATGIGTPLSPDAVRHRVLHPLLERLGIPKCGMHAFRHSTPAMLNEIGLGPALVQRFMRHASLKQTEAYLHVSDGDVLAALSAALARRAATQESAR